MFFLSFLCLGGIVWALGLVFVMRARLRVGIYTALSLLFALMGLTLFTFFSWVAGIMPLRFGDAALLAYSVDFPVGYLARGEIGVAILVLGVLGILSPVLAAWVIGRQLAKPKMANR